VYLPRRRLFRSLHLFTNALSASVFVLASASFLGTWLATMLVSVLATNSPFTLRSEFVCAPRYARRPQSSCVYLFAGDYVISGLFLSIPCLFPVHDGVRLYNLSHWAVCVVLETCFGAPELFESLYHLCSPPPQPHARTT